MTTTTAAPLVIEDLNSDPIDGMRLLDAQGRPTNLVLLTFGRGTEVDSVVITIGAKRRVSMVSQMGVAPVIIPPTCQTAFAETFSDDGCFIERALICISIPTGEAA
jgi:hypothetical protein